MRDPARREMVNVLRESREWIARPGNDFTWSWSDAEAALAEIDGMIAALQRGAPLSAPAHTVVFAPTGPMQELSLSSGWGNVFLALADRWDAAAEWAARMPPPPPGECRCVMPPIEPRDFEPADMGVDDDHGRFADVRIDRCRWCARLWLHYQHEPEPFSPSGRWYRALVTPGQAARATSANALQILAERPWHLYGGSFFGTTGQRSDGPLDPATA
jgi:hypothetical protein